MKSAFNRIRVASCPVDVCSFESTVAELCRRIDSRLRTHVVFVNAAKVVRYDKDPALRAVMDSADMLLPDGVPIVWASRLMRTPVPGRVAGIDLMEKMVAVAAARGYRVFFLGAKSEVVAKTVGNLQRRYPALQVAGFRDGYFRPDEEGAVVAEINDSNTDLLFIGMSTPQKELWVHRNLRQLRVSVCQGVGGSFDILAGTTNRAPLWMQRIGLEWFYRLAQEPGRLWRRYLYTNSRFGWLVLLDLLNEIRHRSASALEFPSGSS